MVVLPPERTGDLPSVRILVIAGQHGDEPAGISAALRVIRAASQGAGPASLLSASSGVEAGSMENLRNVLLLVIPVANPDGLQYGRRANASGKDLNRDWEIRGQPETQAIRSVVNQWAPHLILDLHQWKSGDAGKGGWWLEYLDRKSLPIQNEIQSTTAQYVAQSAGRSRKVQVVASGQQSPGSLAHRAFSRRGYPTLLVEAAVNATPEQQARFLVDVILLSAAHAGAVIPDIPVFPLEAVQTFQYSREFREWMASVEKSAVMATTSPQGLGLAGLWIVITLWGYLVVIWPGNLSVKHQTAKTPEVQMPGVQRLVAPRPVRLPSGRKISHPELSRRHRTISNSMPDKLPPRILEINWFYKTRNEEPAGQPISRLFSRTGR